MAIALATLGGLAPTPASAQGTIEEIVVTAQFRTQNLQQTPIAITAVNGEMLEARSQISIVDIANQAPNVLLKPGSAPYGPSAQAFIRGIGQHDFNFALEPGVGMYVDDVYYSTLTGTIFDLLDLDRIEILRGPQGTLAGQNSIGGAVKLFSRRPDGDGDSFLQATYGKYNRTEVRGAGEFTLVPEQLFARVSGVAVNKDGYVTRYDYACTHPGTPLPSYKTSDDCVLGTEGGKSYTGVRAILRWLPSDRFDINVIADYTNDDSEASPLTLLYVGDLTRTGIQPLSGAPDPNMHLNGVFMGTATGSAFISSTPFGPYALDTFSDSPYINYSTYSNPNPKDGTPPYSLDPIYQVDSWGVSGNIDFVLSEALTLQSITAYRRYDAQWSIDEDGTPFGANTVSNDVWHWQFSQELRLSGQLFDDRVHFALGGYYLDRKSHYGGRVDLLSLQFIEQDDIPGNSVAVFGNADWRITDELSLNVGVRYTDIEKDFTYGRLGIPGNTWAGLAPPAVRSLNGVVGRYAGNRTDWRAAIQYQWTDQIMTYAQFSTGFRSGGVNPRPFYAVQALPHDPETLDAYEIGIKSSLFDRRLRLNLAAFLNDYSGILMTVNQCEKPDGTIGGPCAKPVNAGTAEIKGIEAEAELFATERLSIDASSSYLDFGYKSILPAAQTAGITLAMRAPFSPEWHHSVGMQYEIPLGDLGSLTPRVDYSYQSGFYTAAINRPPFNFVEGYGLVNARLTWRSADETWQGSFEVTNLTDKMYYLGYFDNRGSSRTTHGLPAPPTQWAVTIKRVF